MKREGAGLDWRSLPLVSSWSAARALSAKPFVAVLIECGAVGGVAVTRAKMNCSSSCSYWVAVYAFGGPAGAGPGANRARRPPDFALHPGGERNPLGQRVSVGGADVGAPSYVRVVVVVSAFWRVWLLQRPFSSPLPNL